MLDVKKQASASAATFIDMLKLVFLLGMVLLAPQGSVGDELRPAKLSLETKDIHLRINESFAVTCSAPDALWLGPNMKLVEDMKSKDVLVSDKSGQKMLYFRNITSASAGNYTCRSKSNKALPNSFHLFVDEPVSFGGPREQTAQQSGQATLKCGARGSPTPDISWLRNGVSVLKQADKFEVRKEGLLVKNITREDDGPYVCRAIQYLMDDTFIIEHVINLTVQHEPEWHADYAKTGDLVYGYLGGMANLTCVAEAQPVGNITWLRGEKILQPNDSVTIFGDGRNSTLQLNLTSPSLFGDYTCNATNALGTRARVLTLKWGARAPRPSAPQPRKAADARHALIRVDRPPPPTPPPSPASAAPDATPGADQDPAAAAADGHQAGATELDLTGLRLLVRPAGAGADVPTRVVDLPFNEDYEYTLPDLAPGSWYEVRALWRNAAGLSEESPPGEIHTSELSQTTTATATAASPVAALLIVCSVAILS